MSEAGQPAQERWEKSPRRLTISLNKRRVVERDKSFNDYQHGRLHIRDGNVFLPDPSGNLRFIREATADDYVQARGERAEHESERPTPEEPCVNCGHDARDHRMLETDEVCSECGHSCEYLETDRPTPVAGGGERWRVEIYGVPYSQVLNLPQPDRVWRIKEGKRIVATRLLQADAHRIVADHNATLMSEVAGDSEHVHRILRSVVADMGYHCQGCGVILDIVPRAALTSPARETPVDGWWVDKVPGKGNKHALYHGTESWGASTNADLLHRVAAALNRVPPARERELLEALGEIAQADGGAYTQDYQPGVDRLADIARAAIDAYERGAPK